MEDSTCVLALHGRYTPTRHPVAEEGEADVYSAFVSKAESLGWVSTYSSVSSPVLWGMHNAQLAVAPVERGVFAWFQVGLEDNAAPPHGASGPLLPLALCAGMAVEDFGAYDLTGAQVLIPLAPLRSQSIVVSSLDTWFYPAPHDFERTLTVKVSIDSATSAITPTELAHLLRHHDFGAIFTGAITVTEDAGGHGDSHPKSSSVAAPIADRHAFQHPVRIEARVPRWGLQQIAGIATALSLAVCTPQITGSIALTMELG